MKGNKSFPPILLLSSNLPPRGTSRLGSPYLHISITYNVTGSLTQTYLDSVLLSIFWRKTPHKQILYNMKITQLLASLALLATGARAATSLFSFYADTGKSLRAPFFSLLTALDPATLPYFDSGYESDLPGFYPPIHCISGEDITLVFAEFTIDDEKEGFCLQGYKEPECRDQDLDYIYQWNMSCRSIS